jgi:predicted kinase
MAKMQRSKTGMVIIVSGVPGSGKSYFAQRLAEKLEALYLSSDKIRNSLQARGKYSFGDKMHIYQLMAELTVRHLKQEETIVVDATFYHHEMRDLFSGIVSKHHSKIAFILITASKELSRQRLAMPRADSEADFGVYESMKSLFEPYSNEHLELQSGTENISEMLTLATGYLQQYE